MIFIMICSHPNELNEVVRLESSPVLRSIGELRRGLELFPILISVPEASWWLMGLRAK